MTKQELRIVFMGTPEFAVGTLRALIEGGYNVVAVVTQPDRAVGRHQDSLRPSDVKRYATEKGLPVLQPEKMKDPAFLAQLAAFKADVQVVVAFRMLPEVVWAMPRFGTFNVHAALLPQYRGAAPINWAVINGETMTGVTTFFIDKDIDTGRIIMQRTFPIPDDANVEYVYDGLMKLGAETALDTIDKMIAGNGHVDSLPQDQWAPVSGTLHQAPKIFTDTCRISWNQPAKRVYDFVRGLSPYPCAWSTLCDEAGQPLKNGRTKLFGTRKTGLATHDAPGTLRTNGARMAVACADEWLEIEELQPAGKKRMKAADFLNGYRLPQSCKMS